MNKKIVLSIIVVCFLLAGCAKEGVTPQVGQSPTPAISNAVSSKPTATPMPVPTPTPSPTPTPTPNPNIPTDPISVQLLSVLAQYAETDEILYFQSFPIGDDQYAAFILLEQSSGVWIWYVTASGAQELESYFSYDEEYPPCLWTVDGVTIFKCESIGGSSTISFVWYIKGGKPVALPYRGMDLKYMGDGQFVTIGEAFDAYFEEEAWIGHTYKIYFLYWAGDDLEEYGGIPITQQQLLQVNGAQAVLDTITNAGYTIDEIYYRANNIINVNYHTGDKQNGYCYYHVTLVYENNTVISPEGFNEDTLDDFYWGGIYQAAYFPQIATYPDAFPVH
jgi:hypothetical protein